MLKNLFISTVAMASLCLSQLQAAKPDQGESSSDCSQPLRSYRLEGQNHQMDKLGSRLDKWKMILEKELASNGLRRNKSKNSDYAATCTQSLEADLKKLEKFMIRRKAGTEKINRVLASPNLKKDKSLLHFVFNQPLMDGLLRLASPGIKDAEGSYFAHQDVLNLMETLFPLKPFFVTTLDWKGGLFFTQVSDAALKKAGLERCEYIHFINELRPPFDVMARSSQASMLNNLNNFLGEIFGNNIVIATPKWKFNQSLNYILWRVDKVREWMRKSYSGYKKLVNELKTGIENSDEGEGLINVLPPASLLSRFAELRVFYIHQAEVHNIAPLQGFPVLEDFAISSRYLTDITPLLSMMTLRRVSLYENPILFNQHTDETPEAAQMRIQANWDVVDTLKSRSCEVWGANVKLPPPIAQ